MHTIRAKLANNTYGRIDDGSLESHSPTGCSTVFALSITAACRLFMGPETIEGASAERRADHLLLARTDLPAARKENYSRPRSCMPHGFEWQRCLMHEIDVILTQLKDLSSGNGRSRHGLFQLGGLGTLDDAGEDGGCVENLITPS